MYTWSTLIHKYPRQEVDDTLKILHVNHLNPHAAKPTPPRATTFTTRIHNSHEKSQHWKLVPSGHRPNMGVDSAARHALFQSHTLSPSLVHGVLVQPLIPFGYRGTRRHGLHRRRSVCKRPSLVHEEEVGRRIGKGRKVKREGMMTDVTACDWYSQTHGIRRLWSICR